MNKTLIWAWAIKNSIVVIAWTVLAIVFNKWWIALFAALFVNGIETKHQTYRICDVCGAHSPYADNRKEAIDKARGMGWIHYEDGDKDYCPSCRKELNK